ncbi:MAG: hypothetical protein Q7S31_00195 [bacterium]|nr:hypothetical protein [bacterium]
MNKNLILILVLVAIGSFVLGSSFKLNFSITRQPFLGRLLSILQPSPTPIAVPNDQDLENQVIPTSGVVVPVKWGDLGAQLVKLGVIDRTQFEQIYANAGGLGDSASLLEDQANSELKITPQNSGVVLNLLWALGLGNKNPILDNGPMVDKQNGGAANFASTGGWTIARGDAMQHYSKHTLIKLTAPQQLLVERVSQNIYRPCCDNSTYFPDCNHGMAMLALLELMASQNFSEDEMYKYALAVNSYWFPDTYLTIAKYKASQGVTWDQVNPQEVLGVNYSSATGYQKIRSQVEPVQNSGGGSCGV